jgi:uncharacterized protein (DUF4415 family)
MKKTSITPTEAKIKREIEALKRKPESEIDTSETRVLPPEVWANAVVGKFYRPIKQPIALRLDADVIAWLKSTGTGYQSRINEILRREMVNAVKTP